MGQGDNRVRKEDSMTGIKVSYGVLGFEDGRRGHEPRNGGGP